MSAEAGPAALVAQVGAALAARDVEALRAAVKPLMTADLAELIQLLEPEQRVELIQTLGSDFDHEAWSKLDETVRDQLSEALPNAVIARAVTELETDDAAYVMEGLEPQDQQDVLSQVPRSERAALERNLEYPEETAGRLMQGDFVAVPPYWTVGQVIDNMREADDLPESFSDIFVVDTTHRVIGSIELSRLLRTKRHVGVDKILDTDQHVVLATEDQEEVARQFERYGLRSAPVVDANSRLVGVVTVDDVVEVIEQEADEDIKLLAGVGDERLTDSVRQIAPPRVTWLAINLADGHSGVDGDQGVRCDDRADGVAGGADADRRVDGRQCRHADDDGRGARDCNAGTLDRSMSRSSRCARRRSGCSMAFIFAAIMAAITVVWFGSQGLGLVIGAAMIINLLAAALAGIFIPIVLNRYKFDPAVSSTVFVTTVTDVVGFFAFLGLAAWWLR